MSMICIASADGRTINAGSDLPLYNLNSLTYLGEWFLPGGGSGGARFDGGLGVSCLNTQNNNESLFMAGHIGENMVAEISRPAFNGTATILQAFVDLPSKLAVDPTVDTAYLGGLMVQEGVNKLIVSYYEFYDADSSMTLSHFVLDSLTLATANASAMYNTASGAAGHTAGHMLYMPSYWRTRFGKPLITGLGGGIPITNRTSSGPAAFAIDPTEFSAVSTPTVNMLDYPIANPLRESSDNDVWNSVSEQRGCWIPPNTRSIIFFGNHGTGLPAYGHGTADPQLAGTEVPGDAGFFYIYDPVRLDKGYHAYPYDSWYWHYDLNDLLDVKNSLSERWEPQPIAYGSFDLHSTQADPRVGTVMYDEVNERLVITERKRNNFDTSGVIEFSV
jgi:hypothetical protein